MRACTSSSIVVCALALVLTMGCGTPANNDPDAGTLPPDSGLPIDAGIPDAGEPDAGAPCEGATAPCRVTWTASADFPTRVDHHTTLVHTSETGTWLYVVGGIAATGGVPDAVFASVRRALIGEDGSLGAWESLDDLPFPLAFHAIAQTDGHVYLIAGITRTAGGLQTHRGSLVGDFDGEGKLTWRIGPELPEAFLHPSAQVVGQRVYVLGGSGAMTDPKDKVYVAEIDDTGMIGTWGAGTALPEPRSHHITVLRDGRIYLVGGFRADHTPIEDIYRSVHDRSSGAVTDWEVVGGILHSPWTGAGFVLGDWIYTVGGGEGGPGQETYVGRVQRGRLSADGILTSSFQDVMDSLPIERAHVHQTPVVNGHIYSVGGRDENFDSLSAVYIGRLGAE